MVVQDFLLANKIILERKFFVKERWRRRGKDYFSSTIFDSEDDYSDLTEL